MTEAEERTTRQQIIRNRLLAVIAVIAVLFCLRVGYSVLMPLFVAGFLIAACWPVLSWFRRHLPSTLSYAATIIVMFLIFGVFFATLYFSIAQVTMTFMEKEERFREIYQSYESFARPYGLPTLQSGDGGYDRFLEIGRSLVSTLYAFMSYLGLIAVIVILGFPEVPKAARRFRGIFDPDHNREIFETIGTIASNFRDYIAMTVLSSLITGVFSGLWAYAVGLDLAVTWGILNFILNFIPVVGNLIGIIPPTLYALIQFEGLTMPVVVFVGYAVLQTVISNFVYPALQGRGVSMPPVTIVLSLLIWGYLWGFAGTLLAVPLTAMVVIVCQHFEPTRRFALVFSGDRPNEK